MTPALCFPFTPCNSMLTMTPARCLAFDPLQFNVGLSIPLSIRWSIEDAHDECDGLVFHAVFNIESRGGRGPASGGGSAGRVVNIPSEFSVRIISPGHGLV